MTLFPGRILLATDGSEEAELAAGVAVKLAKSNGSELHVANQANNSAPRGCSGAWQYPIKSRISPRTARRMAGASAAGKPEGDGRGRPVG